MSLSFLDGIFLIYIYIQYKKVSVIKNICHSHCNIPCQCDDEVARIIYNGFTPKAIIVHKIYNSLHKNGVEDVRNNLHINANDDDHVNAVIVHKIYHNLHIYGFAKFYNFIHSIMLLAKIDLTFVDSYTKMINTHKQPQNIMFLQYNIDSQLGLAGHGDSKIFLK